MQSVALCVRDRDPKQEVRCCGVLSALLECTGFRDQACNFNKLKYLLLILLIHCLRTRATDLAAEAGNRLQSAPLDEPESATSSTGYFIPLAMICNPV